MKKSLLASAVLLSLTSIGAAADIQLYGFLDYAIQGISSKNAFTGERTDQLRMVTGERNGNRWGIRGSEQLTDDISVKIHLESGFNADDGQMLSNRIFSRQAALMVESETFGSFKFGRTGGFNAPNDSYMSTAVIASAWGGGTCNGASSFLWYNSREDNVIEYRTPTVNGFTGYLHWSFNINGQEASEQHENQRVAAGGIRWRSKMFDIGLSYEKNFMPASTNYEDPQTITAAARMNFDSLVISAGAQYVDHVRSFGAAGSFANDSFGTLDNYKSNYLARTGQSAGSLLSGLKGFGAGLGAWYDVGPMRYIGEISRLDYKIEDTDEKAGFWMGSLGFHYALSKRTSFWGIAAYGSGTGESNSYEMHQVTLGIRHSF